MTIFPVRPRARSRYRFDVRVFPNEREMRAYERSIGPPFPMEYNSITLCHSDRGWLLGDILFTERSLTPENIAHEASHAAEHYARRIGRRDGETIAAASGRIASEILRRVNA
ncbi:MAG: hypothetical protein ABFD89_09665 [Bryobacteraceae bacterium]